MSAVDTAVTDRRASGLGDRALVTLYVGAFVGAEVLTTYVALPAGVAVHAAIAVTAIHQDRAYEGRAGGDVEGRRMSLSPFLLCLPVVCVARIVPFALPLAGAVVAWPGLVALPILVAIIAARRVGGPAVWRSSWLSMGGWPKELVVALSAIPLSLFAFLAIDPSPLLPDADLARLVVVGASLLLLGAVEETLYRGLIQGSLGAVVGRWAVLVTAMLTAAAALGDRSWAAVLVVGGIALVFGGWVERTERLVGVAVAHGILLIATFLVWPRLL